MEIGDIYIYIKSSDYCAATVAKLRVYSTCTQFAVGFGFVKK